MCDTFVNSEVSVSKLTTLTGIYSPGCLKCVTVVNFLAHVLTSFQKSTQSECPPLLRTQYGSQMCDTFTLCEMSVSKLTYLTVVHIVYYVSDCIASDWIVIDDWIVIGLDWIACDWTLREWIV